VRTLGSHFFITNGYNQGYFCDGAHQNAVPEVLFQMDANRNGIPEPFFPSGIGITNPSLTEVCITVCVLGPRPIFFRKIALGTTIYAMALLIRFSLWP
jgi:hypothetical protein